MADRIDELVAELAKEIAKTQFDINLNIYKEEGEELAEDGVTESAYMKDAIESLEWYIDEQIPAKLYEITPKEYKELLKEKYGK